MIFRMSDKGPSLVRNVLLELGWKEHNEEIDDENGWNLWWKTVRFTNSEIQKCVNPTEQKLNHIPNSSTMTKKDCMVRNLRKMKVIHGSIFNFFPKSFILPGEYVKFLDNFSYERENSDQGQDRIWICKPSDLSRGRKIFLFQDLSDLSYGQQYVVQRYIQDPLLIAGYKFDLRIYVLVTSFHPLKVYLYKEGLARFSTEKYDTNELRNKFSHLTNASINKHSPQYDVAKEGIGPGSKWTLKQLQRYFDQMEINYDFIWKRIENLVNLTLISFVGTIPNNAECCFELYGFDIILDSQLKPWLLEINFSPALNSDSEIDDQVKKPLISDLVKTLQFKQEKIVPSKPQQTVQKLESTMVVKRSLSSCSQRKYNTLSANTIHSNSVIGSMPTMRSGNHMSPRLSTISRKDSAFTETENKFTLSCPPQKRWHDNTSNSCRDDETFHEKFGDFYMIFPPCSSIQRIAENMSSTKTSEAALREIVNYFKKRESTLLKKKCS